MDVTDKEYLILSNLAYIDFDIKKDSNKTIGELLKENKRLGDDSWRKEAMSMSDWKIINFVNNDGFSGSGFAGAAFESPEGNIVFAFRGTEPDKLDQFLHDLVITDGQIALQNRNGLPTQFGDARKFVVDTLLPNGAIVGSDQNALDIAIRDKNVTFTGHSLGGGLAQYLTYLTHGSGSTRAVTFNGVGIGQLLPFENSFAHYRVTDYCDSADIIGIYGVQLGQTIYLKNSGISSSSDEGFFSRLKEYCSQVFTIKSHPLENFLDDFDENGNLIKESVASKNDIGFVDVITNFLHFNKTLPERITHSWNSEYKVVVELLLASSMAMICPILYFDVYHRALKKNVDLFKEKITGMMSFIGDFVTTKLQQIGQGVKKVVSGIGDAFNKFAFETKKAWEKTKLYVVEIANNIVDAGKSAVAWIENFARKTQDIVSNFFTSVSNKVKSFAVAINRIVTNTWNKAINTAKKTGRNIINTTKVEIKKRYDAFKEGTYKLMIYTKKMLDKAKGEKRLVIRAFTKRMVKGLGVYTLARLSVNLIRLDDLQSKMRGLERYFGESVYYILNETNKVTSDVGQKYSETYVRKRINDINITCNQIKDSNRKVCDALNRKSNSLRYALENYKKIENLLCKGF